MKTKKALLSSGYGSAVRVAWSVVLVLVLGACGTLFDSPSMEGMRDTVSERVLQDLSEIAAAQEHVPEVVVVFPDLRANADIDLPEPVRMRRGIVVEPLAVPQGAELVIEAITNEDVVLNGTSIRPEQHSGRLAVPVAAGTHHLQIIPVAGGQFSADLLVEDRERIVVRPMNPF